MEIIECLVVPFEYRLIPGCQNYFAGEDGNIYCNLPFGIGKTLCRLRLVKPSLQSNGKYFKVSVIINGKRLTKRVHRLVCMAFNGLPDNENLTVSHMDGNAFNNRPSNLKWMRLTENHKLKLEHGTDDIGVKNTRSKIKDINTIKEIRKLLKIGKKHSDIANKFGVSRVFITKIANGHRYKGQGL